MTIQRMGDRILARLAIGEEIPDAVRTPARSQALPGAAITGIGAVNDVTLALFDPARRAYRETRLVEDLEVVSMTGNLAWLGEDPIVHLHGVVSRADCTTAAGHIMRAIVSVTLELMVVVYPDKVARSKDPEVGLNLLDLR